MFTTSCKFGITSVGSKLSIQTEPIGGVLKVSIWLTKPHEQKSQLTRGTVFKVNKDFSHKEVLDAPYEHFEGEEASDLDLATYRDFKRELLATLNDHLTKLRNSKYDRSNEIKQIDPYIQIVSRGMRHPDETVVKRGLLGLVKK